ncbi:MAG: GGDEF domain-containing protein [Micromonosporaceae bacterium]|nr:GGDEF domain-containing protein [Micromonosporaceae bacterium]
MADWSQRIVVAVATGFDIYASLVLNGARAVLEEHGVGLVAHTDLEEPVMPATLAFLMRNPAVCAVIIFCPRSAEHDRLVNAPLLAAGVPVVHIGQAVPGHASVRADNAQGMTELMSLVLDQCEARHPALLQPSFRQPDIVKREEIYRAEIARRGLAVDEYRIIAEGPSLNDAKQATRQLLERHPDTDAVVCMHDWCAMVAIEGCLEAGKRVPQDVVVTGFDNYPIPSITWPGVATVDQNLEEQGTTAAHMIIASLTGAEVRDHVKAKCTVLPRGSAAVAGARQDVVPPRDERVARLASVHLRLQDELDQLDQALMRCRTLDDICAVLPESFTVLGITRAFLVIYDAPAEPPTLHGVSHHVARLLLDYRDGQTHPVPEGTFPSCDLLPEHLRDELHRGFLAVQPLQGAERPLGHLFLDLRFGPVPIIANIESVLNRTLEVVSSIQALSDHSKTLERLVAQRSEDLMTEIGIRRSAERELRRANATLRRMEVTDGLTETANRRALQRHFAMHWPQHVESGRELAVLLVDVDHFKAYNDRYGHLRGDEALRAVASCLRRSARRPDDLVCRFGGEEFAVVLPFSGEAQALTVARRFARLLAQMAITHAASPVAPVVTASIGVAALVPAAEDTSDRVLAMADRALYRAKDEGRNRISTESAAHDSSLSVPNISAG